jgi:hypothetical protein
VDNAKPTVASLDTRMGGVEQQLGDLAESLDYVRASIEVLGEGSQTQSERLWSALGTLGGLDGLVGGLADIAEVLAPMRQFAPPSTAIPLNDGVAEALGTIRSALGTEDRDLNFSSLPTRWDGPVGFIGEPVTTTVYYGPTGQRSGQ